MTVDIQPSPADMKQAADRLSSLESQVEGADVNTLATLFVRSGYFQDSTALSQAAVKVIAGKELGIGAFQSMANINIIKGRPSYSANLIASLIQRTDRFRYRVTRIDNEGCTILFFENWGGTSGWVQIGESTFTTADAQRAKLDKQQNYELYPRNMFFARALTNGARWFCPSVTNGEIFTPEEIGATVDDDGNVIEVPTAPPWTQDETKALADRYDAIMADQDGIPPQTSKPKLWQENTRLGKRAEELGITPKVLGNRVSAIEIAAENSLLSERIDNVEMDQRLAGGEQAPLV